MIRRIYNVLALLLITVATAVAQDATVTDPSTLRNKKGEAYLPVADEWALGVSASPFLGYLGNFMNGTVNRPAPAFDYAANPANNIAVFGKKMIDANTAWRVRFNVGVNNTINKAVVDQDQINPNPAYPAYSEDWQKITSTTVVIAPGWEKRRGSTRLQGVYGGELVVGFSKNHYVYQYGNPMTADFVEPNTHDFGTNLPGPDNGARVTDEKSGSNFLVGARGFIGVEYFFAPKISIGGEFGYMVAFRQLGRTLRTIESWDADNNTKRETKVDQYDGANDQGFSSIGVGLDNLSGSINLLFYF